LHILDDCGIQNLRNNREPLGGSVQTVLVTFDGGFSQGRTVNDARAAFQEAKAVAKTDARVLLTDGLESYKRAAQAEFPNAVHVSGVGLQGRVNNNRMERYHGTFKERSKVMRAIKKTDSAFIEGQRIYYDYLRPHTALDGKTPAQAAGIELNLQGNKWESLIKKAVKRTVTEVDE